MKENKWTREQDLNDLHMQLSTFDYPNLDREQVDDLISRASMYIAELRKEEKECTLSPDCDCSNCETQHITGFLNN
jgi:hypothetical protein